jgi:hypothetical protein
MNRYKITKSDPARKPVVLTEQEHVEAVKKEQERIKKEQQIKEEERKNLAALSRPYWLDNLK